jgi:hypothetical protein
VYDGKIGRRELRFEPSGGLMQASLVMQDRETDTYWSLMTSDTLAGELSAARLEELPVGRRVRCGEWLAAYPQTLVLFVDGVEHDVNNPYDNYFASESGFRGALASDDRLPTKAPVYRPELSGRPYAVPHSLVRGGALFEVGGRFLFVHRPAGADFCRSSVAYLSVDATTERDDVLGTEAGATFDAGSGLFEGPGADRVRRLDGFDTFWFNWSMSHLSTTILGMARD